MCVEKFDPCKGELIHVKEIELAQYLIEGGGFPTEDDIPFRVENPTAKLHVTLHVFARPGQNGNSGVNPGPHSYTGETWQLFSVADGNPPVRCNPIFLATTVPRVEAARPLPDTYEAESGIKVVDGSVHVQQNAGTSEGDIMMLRVTWEPTDCEMSAAERAYWFAKCNAKRLGLVDLPIIRLT